MSAFLGPIHHWLYNKIQIQDKIIEEILRDGEKIKPDLEGVLETKFGVTEKRPLEEVIDTENIHGWLQEQVSRSEYKLAYGITELLSMEPEFINNLENIFKDAGKVLGGTISADNASQAYKTISDSLLDGMPCDRSNQILDTSDTSVTWKMVTCVHSPYWEEIGGRIEIYYQLRDEFIQGCLLGTDLIYEKTDEATSRIRRK